MHANRHVGTSMASSHPPFGASILLWSYHCTRAWQSMQFVVKPGQTPVEGPNLGAPTHARMHACRIHQVLRSNPKILKSRS
jgi:hypothetical protein